MDGDSQHRALAELATRQHGVLSAAQLLELGFAATTISRYVAAGRLHRIHRGVYAPGHRALTDHGRCMAAVLSRGTEAVVSHTSAAWLWGVDRYLPPIIEVTTPSRGHGRDAIRVHHSTILDAIDLTTIDGIPTTAIPRTLLDLAARQPSRTLERNLERAERLAILNLSQIDYLLRRCGGHAGRSRLRDGLSLYRQAGYFRSRYERQLGRIVERARIARPSFNFFVEGHELDAYWESHRFAVEVDAYSTHGSPVAFERDHARDQHLQLAGIEIARFTSTQIEREPGRVGAEIRERLRLRAEMLKGRHPA